MPIHGLFQIRLNYTVIRLQVVTSDATARQGWLSYSTTGLFGNSF